MNAIKSYFSNIKGLFSRLGRNPEADWHFALVIFVIGVFVTVAIDAFLFFGLNSSDTATAPDHSAVTLDKKNITSAIEALQKDDESTSKIPSIVRIDPSI